MLSLRSDYPCPARSPERTLLRETFTIFCGPYGPFAHAPQALSDEASRLLVQFYAQLRRGDQSAPGAYHVTVRQLEALIRLGEARARAELELTITGDHVREAKRLLKESITHVDYENIDFMETEAFDEEITKQVDQLDRERGVADAGQAEESAADTAGESGAAEPRKVKSISYDKYSKVSKSIMLYIRSQEQDGDAGAPSGGHGLRQGDVVEWYLNQQDDLDSIEKLDEERKLVKRIIQRMVKIDSNLIPVGEVEGIRVDDRVLTVRQDHVI
jgi:DNA replication licensing factor MCM6